MPNVIDGALLRQCAPKFEPNQRLAGARKVDRQTTIKRIADLLLADPHISIEDAWGFVTRGMHLGTFARSVQLDVFAELAHRHANTRRLEASNV